jgi:hypothetical protein
MMLVVWSVLGLRLGVSQRKPTQKLMRELRKRIVAGPHDHDAVTTTGQLDQAVAASTPIWKG